MDPSDAATDGSVREALLRIEGKLYESGVLVTTTGDSECAVTLAFEDAVVGTAKVFALVVHVTTVVSAHISRSRWRALQAYVVERYAMLQVEFPKDVREVLLECAGPFVCVNKVLIR